MWLLPDCGCSFRAWCNRAAASRGSINTQRTVAPAQSGVCGEDKGLARNIWATKQRTRKRRVCTVRGRGWIGFGSEGIHVDAARCEGSSGNWLWNFGRY